MLTLFTLFAGCATSTVPQPENFSSNPQVVAVYAVDSAFGTLPDVLIFSNIAGDAGKVSANPPPTYGSYRVEFDQPIAGESVANNANRGTGPTPGGAASFCSPLPTNPVQLVDVQGDADRPAGVVVSSTCYDATSPLGSHPHVVVVPGRNALNDPTAAPLTCNTFRADPGLGDGGNVFKANHKYGIKVNPGTILNGAGKPLAAPTGAGWTAAGADGTNTFEFTTSGMKILAAGFQDPNTGFFIWLAKPEPGFEKDLAPCASTSTCPDASGNNAGNAFQKPADSNPFFVVFTEAVNPSTPKNADPNGVFVDVSDLITLTRDDGSSPDASTLTAFVVGAFGDPRIAEVYTGDTFEPGVSYSVAVSGALTAANGDPLQNPATYTFPAQPGGPVQLSTIPANGAQVQGHATVPVAVAFTDLAGKPATRNLAASTATSPIVEFSSSIAATAAGGDTPVGTFKLTGPGGDVPVTAAILGGANNQLVQLTPGTPLLPATTYTVAWSGVRGALQPRSFANQPFPDGSAQFTTASFRMAILDDPKVDTSTSNTNIGRNGFVRSNTTVVLVNLDRRTDVEPADLKSGDFHVVFNNTAAGVDATSLVISEVSGTTVTPVAGATVVPFNGSTTNYQVILPAGYQPKFGQKYEVRAKTSITNPTTGKALQAEGCTAGGTTDCSDVKSFTTRKVSVAVAPDPGSTTATGFRVNFSDPIDPASLNPILTTENHPGAFKLFQRNADGSLSTTPTPINCTITSPTRVTCTAVSGTLVIPNQQASYLASAVFLPTLTQDPAQGGPSGPAIASTSTDPSARFSGNASANVFAPCQ